MNAVTEADKTAAFLSSAGIASNPYGSMWHLVFNDVDDHDAGWWEQQGANNQYFTHWWDPSNVKFPNFNRYLSWVGELHTKTARPQVVWQVPVGNQYFLTMNNTCGHYQDNIGPYFISHASSLYASGLIAVPFGAGNSCQTNNEDVRADGITNNGGAATTDLAGYCNACNTHTSTYADDDGGYLRIFVRQYYVLSAWSPLGGTSLSSPAGTSGSSASDDVFVRGTDNALYQNHWNGTSWSGWSSLGGGVSADPGAAAQVTSRVDAFVRGTDRQLYQKTWNGSLWGAWRALGGGLTYGPGVSVMPGTITSVDVWVTGTDSQLYLRASSDGGNTFAPWQALGGRLTSDPAAVSWSSGRIDVFVRGTDMQLYHRWWNSGSGWSGWEALGGNLSSAPAVASCAAGHLDVYVRGTDNGLYHKSWNSASWSVWQPMGGLWTASPSATCRPGTTTVDLFERDTDNAIWTISVTGS